MPSASEIQALALKLPAQAGRRVVEKREPGDEELESGEITALDETEFRSGIRSRRTA